MQLRYQTGLTGEQYVTAKAWRDARLDRCPNHPEPGSCSLARHGTYRRRKPTGALIARWYCPESHTTFSLLPDCLAARLPGTLQELEKVVVRTERAASREQAADRLRDDIQLPGALRWLRRRLRLVRQVLQQVSGLLPQHLAGCDLALSAFREHLDTDAALVTLRSLTSPWLPAPLGFRPHRPWGWESQGRESHFRTPTPNGGSPPPAAPVAYAHHRVA